MIINLDSEVMYGLKPGNKTYLNYLKPEKKPPHYPT